MSAGVMGLNPWKVEQATIEKLAGWIGMAGIDSVVARRCVPEIFGKRDGGQVVIDPWGDVFSAALLGAGVQDHRKGER